MSSGRRHGAALLVVGLSFAQLGANCVDGFTPDCSDPNVKCGPGPIITPGDASDSSIVIPDGGPDAQPTDTGTDAGDASDAADGG